MSSVSAHTIPFWSSRLAFVLAASGSAVGLGNIWRFPYIAGEGGGGAFVLVYLLFILLLGLPLLIAELFVGRRGRANPADAYRNVAQEFGSSRAWRMVGWMGVVTALLILSFYSVIAGWGMAYVGEALNGSFSAGLGDAVGLFGGLVSDPMRLFAWHSVFMVVTTAVLVVGVRRGIEPVVKLFVPLLLVILIALVVMGYQQPSFAAAWDFLFSADFKKLTPTAIMSALGMAFFSLSVGAGTMMMYGAYLPSNVSIPRVAIAVMLVDTGVALLAGLAIFPWVFAFDLPASEGPGLAFQMLPMAFSQLANGNLLALLFFTLLVIAAFTSAISLMEPGVAWLMARSELARGPSAFLIGTLVWLLGLVTVFSFNLWQDWRPLVWFSPWENLNGFQLIDGFSSNILLPLGGLALAWFVTRFISRDELAAELGMSPVMFVVWRMMLQYMVRIAIGLILLDALGVIRWLANIFNVEWY
jgi:NSS family neurotransmitter:Na+ symporter